jgi:hypothetical protein
VAGNQDGAGAPDCSASAILSEGHNLLGSLSGCLFSPTTGDQTGVDPLLGPLMNNRGATSTHALLPGSPAIDTANPGPPGSGGVTCEPTDQRLYRRPADGDGAPGVFCDKGSFEVCNATYADMAGNFFEPFVRELTCRGIASGCGGGNYCPGSAVLRQEMAVFLVLAKGEQPSGVPHNTYFNDVPDNGFAGYINRLYELGITGGCAPGLFCPASTTNRDQMAVFLVLAMEEQAAVGTAHNTYFNDLGPPTHPINPFYPFINRLRELNITTGCGGGAFCPGDPMLRGTMAPWLVTGFFSN